MLSLPSLGSWSLTVILLASLLPATALRAQVIEEVVVTAQKRQESAQNVPISISTFSGDFMRESGVDTLQDLGYYSPNLTLSHSSQVANHRIIMRGVGSVGNNAIEPSVAVFIDGIYYPRPASVVGNLTDVEMVEVLRGPQGTLFGRNASMGALNIRTAEPSRNMEGEIRGRVGNYGRLGVSGFLSNAISNNTSARVAINYSDRDGYGDNSFTEGQSRADVGAWEDLSVRGKLQYTPADNLDITLSADYSQVKNQSSVIEVKSDTVIPDYLTTLGLVLDPDSVPGTTPPGPPILGPVPETDDSFDYDINQDHQDSATDEQWGLGLHVDLEVANHTLRSITSYRDWNNDTFESALRLPGDLLNRDTGYTTESFSQELQLLSATDGRLEYVAGLYYYSEDYTIDQDFNLGPDFCQAASNAAYLLNFQGALQAGADQATANAAGLAASGPAFAACDPGIPPPSQLIDAVDADFNQEVTSLAAYGQFTMNVTDRARFTLGLRWTNDDKSGSFSQAVNNISLSPQLLDLRIDEPATELDFEDDKLTWLANVSYDLTEDVMVFANYSTGYKSGGFNSDGFNSIGIANNSSRVYDSETVDNYEAGFKSRIFNNRIVANVTMFRTEIQDYQDRQFDGVNFFVQNAAELTQQGIELDIMAQPTEQLYAVLGVSYLDSEFDNFPDATNLPAVVAATQNTNRTRTAMMLPPIPVPPRDLSGERNHFSPKWQFSLVGEWTDYIPNTALSWFLRGEYQYIGKQNVGVETNQNPQSIQEGYSLLNARVGVRGNDVNWEVAAYARNLTDKGYCQTIFNQPIGTTLGLVDPSTGGGMQRCVLGTPRTFGMEATYRF